MILHQSIEGRPSTSLKVPLYFPETSRDSGKIFPQMCHQRDWLFHKRCVIIKLQKRQEMLFREQKRKGVSCFLVRYKQRHLNGCTKTPLHNGAAQHTRKYVRYQWGDDMSNYYSEKELPVMLTVQDIAAFLRVSKNTAYSFVSSGAIPVVKVGR